MQFWEQGSIYMVTVTPYKNRKIWENHFSEAQAGQKVKCPSVLFFTKPIQSFFYFLSLFSILKFFVGMNTFLDKGLFH